MAMRAKGTNGGSTGQTLTARHPEVPGRSPGLEGRTTSRLAEARTALDTVLDPELDESVTSLGFIGDLGVDGDAVSVTFRLPTAWCSLNFAWIMAEDMRDALFRLDWVRSADIRLIDHFAAKKINAGIAGGQDFATAFGADAGGSLAALRDTFRRKAYLGRMATLIGLIRKIGRDDPAIARLTMADLAAAKAGRWPHRRASTTTWNSGPFSGDRPSRPTRLSATLPVRDIPAGSLTDFLRDIRMRRRGVEANGEMCRVMLKARYGDQAPAG